MVSDEFLQISRTVMYQIVPDRYIDEGEEILTQIGVRVCFTLLVNACIKRHLSWCQLGDCNGRKTRDSIVITPHGCPFSPD